MRSPSFLAPLAVTLALACAGCAPANRPHEPDLFLGCGTDEAWRSFDEQEQAHTVKVSDAQAPRLTAPAMDGLTLAASPAPPFAWTITATLDGQPSGDVVCPQCPTCGMLGAQHLPPISGDVYDLQFTVDGAVAYRVITTQQHLALPDAVWAGLRAKSVALVIVRMQLKVNDLQDGPFQASAPLRFTVGG